MLVSISLVWLQVVQPQDTQESDQRPIIVTGVLTAEIDRQNDADDNVVSMIPSEAEQRSVFNAEQVMATIPNVMVGNSSLGPAIRGQDSTGLLNNLSAALGGARTRATIDVDGRSIGYFEYVFGDVPLYDLSVISVVRGPLLHTLARPSPTGGVFLRTADPSDDFEASGRMMIASRERRQVSTFANVPIDRTFNVSARASVDVVRAMSPSRLDGPFGEIDPNRNDTSQVRVKISGEPPIGDDTYVVTTFVHTESRSPQFDGITPPFERRRDDNALYGVFEIKSDSWTTEASGQHGEGDWRVRASLGAIDTTRFAPSGLGELISSAHDYSFAGAGRFRLSERIGFLIGGRVEQVNQHQAINLSALGVGWGRFDDHQHDVGGFAQMSFEVTDELDIRAGARLQSYHQHRSGSLFGPHGERPLEYDVTRAYLSPSFGATYRINRAVSLHLVVEHGVQPGGVTIIPFSGEQDEFLSEKVWHVEASTDLVLTDNISLDVNLFYDWIVDAQRTQLELRTIAAVGTLPVSRLSNAPRAHAMGTEITSRWKFGERVDLRLALGLLDTRIDQTVLPQDPITGKAFQRAPPWSVSGLIVWQPFRDTRVGFSVRGHGGYFSDDANTAATSIKPNVIFDGRITHQIGPVEIFAYGRNLFDQFAIDYYFSPTLASAEPARQVGGGLSVTF